MRVLVVDDDPAVSGALDRALRLEGYEVTVALDGPEALEEIAVRPPDAVILDIGLPDDRRAGRVPAAPGRRRRHARC